MSRDFQVQIRRKIAADFAGFSWEKSQNSRKNQPISREKSQNSQKNLPILRHFSRKKVKFRRIFRGKFIEKSADFTGNFRGKLRQETISKKHFAEMPEFRGSATARNIRSPVNKQCKQEPLPLLILLIVNWSPFIYFLTLATYTSRQGVYSVFTLKKLVFSNSFKKSHSLITKTATVLYTFFTLL